MRQNLAKALEVEYASALLVEAEGQWAAGDSADAGEGATAFLEKRKPAFTGK
jgi:2-(1,2-epoxy-1,2-dihydrophenyl)acetyl-CoA isomerase